MDDDTLDLIERAIYWGKLGRLDRASMYWDRVRGAGS